MLPTQPVPLHIACHLSVLCVALDQGLISVDTLWQSNSISVTGHVLTLLLLEWVEEDLPFVNSTQSLATCLSILTHHR